MKNILNILFFFITLFHWILFFHSSNIILWSFSRIFCRFLADFPSLPLLLISLRLHHQLSLSLTLTHFIPFLFSFSNLKIIQFFFTSFVISYQIRACIYIVVFLFLFLFEFFDFWILIVERSCLLWLMHVFRFLNCWLIFMVMIIGFVDECTLCEYTSLNLDDLFIYLFIYF